MGRLLPEIKRGKIRTKPLQLKSRSFWLVRAMNERSPIRVNIEIITRQSRKEKLFSESSITVN